MRHSLDRRVFPASLSGTKLVFLRFPWKRGARLAAWLVPAAAACSAGCGDASRPSKLEGGGGAAGSGSSVSLLGFEVLLDATTSVSSLSGTVYDGTYPDLLVWTTQAASEGCELRVPSTPFCDPPCGAEGACVAPDRCAAFPKAVNVGDVRVSGLGDTAFTMTPREDNSFYRPPPSVRLPYPPAADGAPVRLEAEGGAFEPFVLESEGIAPLLVTSSQPVPIAKSEPLEVAWTPGASRRTRMLIELNLARHGGQKGKLSCNVPDSGRASIPPDLVTDLIALGIAGFPKLVITRRATGAARVSAGVVELLVSSRVSLDVSVPGLTSCNVSEDCPTGQSCQRDLQCK